jgi:zinc/manganese transport system substrate-binding protein
MRAHMLSLTLSLLGALWCSHASADLQVVTTTPDLAAVAKAVGSERVAVTALALHTQDPHFVDARPHLALAVSRADLLLSVGLDLEIGWLRTLQMGSRNGRIQSGAAGYLDCSQFVEKLEVPTARVDRSMGDIHPGGNPHYMFDPRRVVKVAQGIAERMAKLDPEHAAHYRGGASRFAQALEQARVGWEARLGKLRGAKVVAYHRSLAYLADWLGLQVVAHVEPKPGIPPSPRHIASLLEVIKSEGVKLILQETYYGTQASSALASRAGAKVVLLSGGPDLGARQDYLGFLGEVVRRIEGAR